MNVAEGGEQILPNRECWVLRLSCAAGFCVIGGGKMDKDKGRGYIHLVSGCETSFIVQVSTAFREAL